MWRSSSGNHNLVHILCFHWQYEMFLEYSVVVWLCSKLTVVLFYNYMYKIYSVSVKRVKDSSNILCWPCKSCCSKWMYSAVRNWNGQVLML
jgi:hypothetical protein